MRDSNQRSAAQGGIRHRGLTLEQSFLMVQFASIQVNQYPAVLQRCCNDRGLTKDRITFPKEAEASGQALERANIDFLPGTYVDDLKDRLRWTLVTNSPTIPRDGQ
jgi:hypothetical protein